MHLQAEKIKKKYKNLRRKASSNKQKNTSKTRLREDDVVFIKKIPPKTDDVTFIKQFPVHAGERLKRKTKKLKSIHPCNK